MPNYYSQLITCSNTYQSNLIDNSVVSSQSEQALNQLILKIIEPCAIEFGDLKLTYGFCSHKLMKQILKNKTPGIAPKLDQHSSFEVNSKGNRICSRDGAACDFIIESHKDSMHLVAIWIIENLPFDRLYFYGKDRPIHVSYGPDHSQHIVKLLDSENNKRIPRKISGTAFKAKYE